MKQFGERNRRSESLKIFGLSCEIDIDYVPKLRAMLRRQAEARCKALILDLSDVYEIDPAAVKTLIDYYSQAAVYQGVLCLCGVNEGLKPVFEAVETGDLLPMRDTVPEAIAAIKQGEIRPFEPTLVVVNHTHSEHTRISVRTAPR